MRIDVVKNRCPVIIDGRRCVSEPGHEGDHAIALSETREYSRTALVDAHGRAPRPIGPANDFVTRRELDDDLDQLAGAMVSRQQLEDFTEVVRRALEIHQRALQQLERRSVEGRVRRVRAWLQVLVDRVKHDVTEFRKALGG